MWLTMNDWALISLPHNSFSGASSWLQPPTPPTNGYTKIEYFFLVERIERKASLSPGVFILHVTLSQKNCSSISNPYSKTNPREAQGTSRSSCKSFTSSLTGRGQERLSLLCPGSLWFSFWFLLLVRRCESLCRSSHLCLWPLSSLSCHRLWNG